MTSVDTKPLKLGVIGIGVGAAEMLPPMERAPYIDLFAGADVNPDVRERFQARYEEARVYDSAEALCKDPDVEAVWISTPNRFHGPMTVMAANHGKHVVVEKPMALDIRQAEEMVEACDRNGVKLVAGHTQSFMPHIRLMRQIVASGEMGALGAVNAIAYTDWVIRPRTADELDPDQGGGLVYRQTPHQIDSIRLIAGGKVRRCPRFVRPVDEVPFHPRLLRRVPGVRERRHGRGHPQRLRLLRGVGARAVGRREQRATHRE